MRCTRHMVLIAACLLGACAAATKLAPPAHAGDFTAFAEDEDICRQAGTAAIKGAAGPAAARLYDMAHGSCMAARFRLRMMDAYRNAAPYPYPDGNPHSFDYPDAFYSIPYATPGYGYDGFSP